MAPRLIFLLISLIFLYLTNTSQSDFQDKIEAFLHPLNKGNPQNLYFVSDAIGHLNLRIDLNGATPLLLNCATAAKSPTYHPIKCGTTRCNYANPNLSCPYNATKKSTCHSTDNSRLFRDTVELLYTTNGVTTMDNTERSSLTLTCTDDATALKAVPSGLDGIMGLANTHLSIPSQLFSLHKLPSKISLCLPSYEGMKSYAGGLWIGDGPYYYAPFRNDVSKIFASTPLIGSGEYLIDVNSIQVGGKNVPTLHGATKICTLTHYTVLQTSIYKALIVAFSGEAKMVKAPAVKPFGACFRSNGGRGVPVIDLLLRGGAKWRIHGSNSLVSVDKNVVCLAFVDGGVNPKNPIVIGGYQMEDNLVEFDLKASKVSFTSSLLVHNTSCSVNRFLM